MKIKWRECLLRGRLLSAGEGTDKRQYSPCVALGFPLSLSTAVSEFLWASHISIPDSGVIG